MMMQSDMQSMPGDSGAEQVCVTITAVGDGTYTVSMSESADADDQGSSDAPQTANSINDALMMAKQMLGAEADEESGEGEAQDGNAQMSPDDAKSAWKQMAGKKQSQGMYGE